MRLAVLLLGACASSIRTAPRGDAGLVIDGAVTYERRRVTEQGLSSDGETLPARRVLVEALDAGGTLVATTATDDQGRFRLRLRDPTALTVRASTVIVADGFDVRVLHAPGNRTPHAVGAPGIAPWPAREQGQSVVLHAGLGGEEPGGAFHVLDRFLDGLRAVRESVGVTLPPLIGLWRRGNNGSEANTSYFREESDVVPGAFELQLMGGDAAAPDRSDSDQFDSGIILHEFGHFVSRVLGADSSIAGQHDRQRSMVPGLAFEEAFATFFACAVLREPLYLDTVGVEPQGHVRMREHMEDAGDDRMRGVGAETTTFELLWDLADGDPTLPDRDGDGTSLGLGAILRVLQSFERSADDYPYIGLFLERARAMGLLDDARIVQLIKRPRAHGLSWPLAGTDLWPMDLSLPGSTEGKVDGLTEPARAGGPPDPNNGFDAVQAYRFRLTKTERVQALLQIAGSGRVADRQDIDLELYDINTDRIAASATEAAEERIEQVLGPGSYVLYVRDGGGRNRASYRLELRGE